MTDRPSDDHYKGMFTNYVDKILDFFDHLPPCVDIFYGMNVDNFKTTYLPRLVNVVCEQLLTLVGVGPARAISKRNSSVLGHTAHVVLLFGFSPLSPTMCDGRYTI